MGMMRRLFNVAGNEYVTEYKEVDGRAVLQVLYKEKLILSCYRDEVLVFPSQRRVVLILDNQSFEFFYDEQAFSFWSSDDFCQVDSSCTWSKSYREKRGAASPGEYVRAGLSGRVTRIACVVGAFVNEGQPLLYVEAMKMENEITANRDGIIKTILIVPGNVVKPNEPLILFEKKGE